MKADPDYWHLVLNERGDRQAIARDGRLWVDEGAERRLMTSEEKKEFGHWEGEAV